MCYIGSKKDEDAKKSFKCGTEVQTANHSFQLSSGTALRQ